MDRFFSCVKKNQISAKNSVQKINFVQKISRKSRASKKSMSYKKSVPTDFLNRQSSISSKSQISLVIDEKIESEDNKSATFSDKVKLFEKRGSLIEPKNAFGVNPEKQNEEC